MAYSEIEPFGDVETRSYWRAGLIASTIANVNRDPKRQRKQYSPEDYMPKFGRQPEPDPEEQSRRMLATVERLNKAFGGIDKRRTN